MTRIILLFIICLTPLIGFSHGGEISGNVKDSENPIPFADVVLKGTDVWTTTDEQGNFELSDIPEGEYTLEIYFVGYNTYQKEISVLEDNKRELTIVLDESNQTLGEIVITGVTRKTLIRENPIAVSTISAEKINLTLKVIL